MTRLREAEDAGKRDMQIGEDAHLARLDHVLAEAGEIARAGAAGIDRRGDAAGAAELLGIDAERGAAPIDVGVQIDQAGRDDITRHVAHVGRRIGLEFASDRGHLAAGKGDIRYGVELLGRIDDPAAAHDQIERHRNLRVSSADHRHRRTGSDRSFARSRNILAGPASHAETSG